MNKGLKVTVSVLAVVLAAAHLFLPSITIDLITLILLVIAVLPWFLKYIAGFEIPGVVKITLSETKAATDKLTRDRIIKGSTGRYEIKGSKAEISRVSADEKSLESLRQLSNTNPNLALVGFRIELEKRIFLLAEQVGIPIERKGLTGLIRELTRRQVISTSGASGILDVVALGNQAAHGAEVSPDAANWVLDIGPSILLQLDDEISPGGPSKT